MIGMKAWARHCERIEYMNNLRSQAARLFSMDEVADYRLKTVKELAAAADERRRLRFKR
jgi:hypothetical protein